MLKYIIYALVAALAVWAVWYLIRTVRRQLRVGGGGGGVCHGCSYTCMSCNNKSTMGRRWAPTLSLPSVFPVPYSAVPRPW